MKIKFLSTVILLQVAFISLSFAQVIIKGKGLFQIDCDFARFTGDRTRNYVEVYYGIRESMLSYTADSNQYNGAVRIRVTVHNNGGIISEKETTIRNNLTDTTTLFKNQTLVGLEGFGLPYGEYILNLSAYDDNCADRKDSVELPLSVKDFGTTEETLSDIELCASIQSSSNKQSHFYKNTLEVFPNASKLYGIGLPILYYYVEAYNLKIDEGKGNFVIKTSVVDALGKDVITAEKNKPRLLNSTVEVGNINLAGLKGGTYILKIALLDSNKGVSAFSEKKFFVYKRHLLEDNTEILGDADVSNSEYAVMSETEIDQEMLFAKYISTDLEQEQYQKLNSLDAKRKFAFSFWRKRNNESMIDENKFKDDYKKRIVYANENYSYGLREGWKTDRGRVYVVYGAPDDIEGFPMTSESNQYEIWHYNSMQNGVIYVFVDHNSLGDFVLVHSNHPGEIQNEDWYRQYAKKVY